MGLNFRMLLQLSGARIFVGTFCKRPAQGGYAIETAQTPTELALLPTKQETTAGPFHFVHMGPMTMSDVAML
jgi:hypothetical protein